MRTSSCLLALAAMQILVAPVCAVAQSAQPSVLSLDEALARALAEAHMKEHFDEKTLRQRTDISFT